jgi:hypothetical protein
MLTGLEVSVHFPDLGILGAGGLSAQQVRKVEALTGRIIPSWRSGIAAG